MFRSGFVAVVGKANAGKSTLINALIGKKVSIVSPKPQTTRNKILGVLNEKEHQVIFIDTPGIHKVKNSLDKYMQKAIETATKDIDALIYVIDASKDFDEDLVELKKYLHQSYPVFVVVNKIDLSNFEKLYPKMAVFNEIDGISQVFGVSALKQQNLQDLKNEIFKVLVDNVNYFPNGEISDKDLKFQIAETIREKILWEYDDEIPHGVGVVVENLENNEKIVKILATIYCERESHKTILLGSRGSKIKQLGTASRQAIEKMVNKKVFLELFIKVKQDWRNKINLEEFGYTE